MQRRRSRPSQPAHFTPLASSHIYMYNYALCASIVYPKNNSFCKFQFITNFEISRHVTLGLKGYISRKCKNETKKIDFVPVTHRRSSHFLSLSLLHSLGWYLIVPTYSNTNTCNVQSFVSLALCCYVFEGIYVRMWVGLCGIYFLDGLVPEYDAMRVYAFLPTFILFDIKELYWQ